MTNRRTQLIVAIFLFAVGPCFKVLCDKKPHNDLSCTFVNKTCNYLLDNVELVYMVIKPNTKTGGHLISPEIKGAKHGEDVGHCLSFAAKVADDGKSGIDADILYSDTKDTAKLTSLVANGKFIVVNRPLSSNFTENRNYRIVFTMVGDVALNRVDIELGNCSSQETIAEINKKITCDWTENKRNCEYEENEVNSLQKLAPIEIKNAADSYRSPRIRTKEFVCADMDFLIDGGSHISVFTANMKQTKVEYQDELSDPSYIYTSEGTNLKGVVRQRLVISPDVHGFDYYLTVILVHKSTDSKVHLLRITGTPCSEEDIASVSKSEDETDDESSGNKLVDNRKLSRIIAGSVAAVVVSIVTMACIINRLRYQKRMKRELLEMNAVKENLQSKHFKL